MLSTPISLFGQITLSPLYFSSQLCIFGSSGSSLGLILSHIPRKEIAEDIRKQCSQRPEAFLPLITLESSPVSGGKHNQGLAGTLFFVLSSRSVDIGEAIGG